MTQRLMQQIAEWDGKSKDDITKVYQGFKQQKDLVSTLISYLENPTLQKGASWLIKHLLEQQFEGNKKQHKDGKGLLVPIKEVCLINLYEQLANFNHWQVKLHILQSLPYLAMPPKSLKKIECFLRTALIDNNKFVRAWAYNGFHLLGVNHPQYKEEAKQFLTMGLRDEPASVKARIRNISKDQK